MTKLPLGSIRVRDPPHNPYADASLAATSSFNDVDENRVPTAQGAGRRCLSVECGHRNLESREGSRKYYPSQGSFWFRQRYPRNDQSEFPSGSLLTERGLKRA